jgi:ribosome biogenesis GTPase
MSEAPALEGDVIRLARADEITLLPELERQAAARFRDAGLEGVAESEPHALAFFAEAEAAHRVWVAVCDDVVVGFAVAEELAGDAYLAELDVLPEHGGRGLGRQLVEQVLLWALAQGYSRLVLRTFLDVPWNGPWYRRLGFEPCAPKGEAWSALIDREREAGLAEALRGFLCRDLSPRALEPWGWSGFFASQLAEMPFAELTPGRVVKELRGWADVVTAAGEVAARIAGRLKRAAGGTEAPAIGDWVLVRLPKAPGEGARIEAIFERKSKFSRKAAGARTDEQVVAANVDRLFVVMGLDADYNPRRLERYLLMARESGAEPVIVLNKADLTDHLEDQLAEVATIAGDAPVHVVAAKSDQGLDALRPLLNPHQTVALVGSSGVGKSTLVNHLSGADIMATRKVRESDARGQHTTTHRELIRLPNGALLIDNPGIRELQLWDADQSLDETFDDVFEVAATCRFRDCTHEQEPGCAVLAAVAAGELSAERLASWRKMGAELASLGRRQDGLKKLEEKRRWRSIHKNLRDHKPRTL